MGSSLGWLIYCVVMITAYCYFVYMPCTHTKAVSSNSDFRSSNKVSKCKEAVCLTLNETYLVGILVLYIVFLHLIPLVPFYLRI
jgi:hypothetical protein